MPDRRITKHLYIEQLEDGPKTTRDMVLSLMVCGSSVARMMQKLRKEGVVQSSRVEGVHGNVWRHELIHPINEIEYCSSCTDKVIGSIFHERMSTK